MEVTTFAEGGNEGRGYHGHAAGKAFSMPSVSHCRIDRRFKFRSTALCCFFSAVIANP
jgi:hypothetical protein